jgi:hypothetical protein
VTWHGAGYRVEVPPVPLPAFLALEGLRDPPPGDVLLVLRRRSRLWDLLRRPPAPFRGTARAVLSR